MDKVLNIKVNESGYDEAIAKTQQLTNDTEELDDAQKGLGGSVLDNGGAMGLLNDATGGLAMTIKDAVEATDLFTKGTKANSVMMGIYNVVVGTSTGLMKAFRIALAATGVGLLVLALVALITNFDKVKAVLTNLIPGFSLFADAIGSVIQLVTDLVGITSDASRELDKLNEQAEKSAKKNKEFLELYGDLYDDFTKRKVQANIDYAENVKKVNEDEAKSESQKLETIKKYRERANREILDAENDRNEEREKKRKDAAEKEQKEIDDNNKKIKTANEKRDKEEEDRKKKADDKLKELNKANQDLLDITEQDKLNRQKEREQEDINSLKLTNDEKVKIQEAFNQKYTLLQNALNEKVKESNKKILDEVNTIEEEYKNKRLDLEAKTLEEKYKRDLIKIEDEKNAKLLALEELKSDEIDKEEAKIEIENYYKTLKKERDIAYGEETEAKREADDAALIESEQRRNDAIVAVNQSGLSALDSLQTIFQGKSKGWQVASKALALTQIGIDSAVAFSKMMQGTEASAAGAASVAGPAAPGVYTATKIAFYASGVATILANIAKAKSILSSGGSSAGGGSAGGAAAPAAPSFNIVGQSSDNQLATSIAGAQSQPQRSYVLSTDVTSNQAMDRNIVNNATFIG